MPDKVPIPELQGPQALTPAPLGVVPSGPWIPPRLRKPWTSAIPPILLEWFQDRRAEGFAKNTCINYAFDLKDLAGFLTVPLEEATAADLRAYQRSLLVRGLAVQTRGRRITAVRQFYEWLRKRQG